jgi:thiol-disulfide isomerase/thioredoxin
MTRRSLLAGLLAIPISISAARADVPARTLAPLSLANGWIGDRLTPEALRGRVVLVDVFTFECINCTHVTPSLKRLDREYGRDDLEIVAVHTPEVPAYQSRIAYLAAQKRAAQIPWPIAIDNGYRIWNAYDVSAWPTQLVFDRHGVLRETFVGEGNDAQIAARVRELVRERE